LDDDRQRYEEARHATARNEAADEAMVDPELDPAPDAANPGRNVRPSAADANATRRALTTTRRRDDVDPRARIARNEAAVRRPPDRTRGLRGKQTL
jgi:hypothetical protein